MALLVSISAQRGETGQLSQALSSHYGAVWNKPIFLPKYRQRAVQVDGLSRLAWHKIARLKCTTNISFLSLSPFKSLLKDHTSAQTLVFTSCLHIKR